MIKKISTEQEMQTFGAEIAATAKAGNVFALIGNLGAGKTQFCKGFLLGLGYSDDVTSPTFSLVHEYEVSGKKICHFDWYRLKNEAELLEMGWDEFVESDAILLVEWADLFPSLMPAHTQWIKISSHENGREVFVS